MGLWSKNVIGITVDYNSKTKSRMNDTGHHCYYNEVS